MNRCDKCRREAHLLCGGCEGQAHATDECPRDGERYECWCYGCIEEAREVEWALERERRYEDSLYDPGCRCLEDCKC